MSSTDPASRRFLIQAVAVALVLAGGALALSFLRSEGSWGLRVDPDFHLDLTQDATGGFERRDGRMILGDGVAERTSVRLRTLDLEARERYLITLRAGRGRAVTIGGVERPSGNRVRLRFPARTREEEYRRLLDYGEAVRLRLVLAAEGPEPVVIESLTLDRVSRLRAALIGALPALGLLAIIAFLWRHRRRLRFALVEPTPTDDIFFAAVVLALCLVAFQRAPVQQMMDGRGVTSVSYALLHMGKLSVMPEAAHQVSKEGREWPYWLLRLDGEIYHYSYTPVAILNTPFVWVYERLGISPMSSDGFNRDTEIGILRGIAAMLAAGLCATLYGLARLRLVPWMAIGLTWAFAFGTQIFSSISRPYWSHAWATLLLALGLLLALTPRFRRGRWPLVASASLLALASACRPSMVLSLLAVAALLWRQSGERRRIRLFLSTAVVWGLALSTGFWLLMGSALPLHILQFHADWSPAGVLGQYASGVLGSLVSPARGALLYVPLFACILWMAWRHRGRLAAGGRPSRALVAAALVVIGVHWQLLVLSRAWSDGQAFGSRLFSDVVVWFFLLGVLVVDALAKRGVATRSARFEIAAVAVAVAASLFVNARGAMVPATWHWDWLDRPPSWLLEGEEPMLRPPRVWNWRYPQFLAGLLPREADGRELRRRHIRDSPDEP